MLNEKMEVALNEQINKELFSSYLYLAMAAYFDNKSLDGFSNWMKVQAQEEVSHAMKIYRYVVDRGGRVLLGAIEKPDLEWDSNIEAFEAAYKHEQFVTESINSLVTLAYELKDHATHNFLEWFVEEQVEEEANASEIVDRLKLVGDNGNGIFNIDRLLSQRAFVDETAQ